MKIENQKLILEYFDETWGSCRHWQIVESYREIQDKNDFENVIRDRNGWIVAWEGNCIEKQFNDSRRNRHRQAFYEFKLPQLCIVKRFVKNYPSCNKKRWQKYFEYLLIENGQIINKKTIGRV